MDYADDTMDESGQQEEAAAAAENLMDQLRAVVGRLANLAQDNAAKRLPIEERWLKNLRAYLGIYDADIQAKMKEPGNESRSKVFVRLTRHKTHAWQARLSDMLFPTEDRNWDIMPTPVPTLTKAAQKAAEQHRAKLEEANQLMAQSEGAESPEQEAVLKQQAAAAAASADEAKAAELQRMAELREAEERCQRMRAEMDDQLVECRYNSKARDVIDMSVKLGTGVMCGPMVSNDMKRSWVQQPVQGGQQPGEWALEMSPDPTPVFRYVDIWSYYPDMTARTIEEAEFHFECFLPNRTAFKRLAKKQGFYSDATARVLKQAPRSSVPSYLQHLRTMSTALYALNDRYTIWLYTGPLEESEVVAILSARGEEQMLALLEQNPTEEYQVMVWFGEGELLKIGIHPLDSGDPLYSVYCFEPDDACIFGFGVPELMCDSQTALNGAWRMILDNGGLSVGPQIVVDTTKVQPSNGNWSLEPMKVWKASSSWPAGQQPFMAFNVSSNQQNLAQIIEMSLRFSDDETSMPIIAQGEQAAHVTQTMGGMSMLMNSANVVFRRVVKRFDDDMTMPNITRLYDWNMQFNPDDSLKGDYKVDARGSSVLLTRELQSPNLMAIAERWSSHPVLGQFVRDQGLPAARKAVQTMMIRPDEVLLTDDEWETQQKKLAETPPPPSPDEIKLQIAQMEAESRMQLAEIDREVKMTVAQTQREVALMQLAGQQNMKLEELRARLAAVKMQSEGKERIFAAEAAMEKQRAEREGVQSGGSGGYL